MSKYLKHKEYVNTKKVLLTSEDIKITLEVYDGFDTVVDAVNFVREKDIDLEIVSFVKFMEMYYLVLLEDNEWKSIIGKNVNWQAKNHYLEIKNNTRFKLSYTPTTLQCKSFNPQIYNDLKLVDSDLKVFLFTKGRHEDVLHKKKYCDGLLGSNGFFEDITEFGHGQTFAVLLGLTFYSSFFSGNIALMIIDKYFSRNYFCKEPFKIYKMPHTVVLGINPFKGEQLLDDGSIRKKRFYEPDNIKKRNRY